jgi:hypothetical protein
VATRKEKKFQLKKLNEIMTDNWEMKEGIKKKKRKKLSIKKKGLIECNNDR